MQAGGRRGDGAGLVGEHGLIIVPVRLAGGAARGDVRGQGDFAEPVDRLVERCAREGERQRHLARLALRLDLGVERAQQAGVAL